MLNLEEVLEEQKDLLALCRDRRPESGEIFSGNSFYGTDRIIKRYAGLPEGYKLRAVLPHGICLSSDYIWEAERNISLPVMFVCPEYRKNIYHKETNKLCVPIASPFLYLKTMLDKADVVNTERNGTIFFPSHSTHGVTAVANYEAMAEKLDSMEQIFKPITVCIYWKDYLLGYHKEFEKKGFNIVSCGHMYDPKFLYRFYYLTRIFRFASSNHVGSHLFYSIAMGCAFFLLEGCKRQNKIVGNNAVNDIINTNSHSISIHKEFSKVVTENTDKQLFLVNKYMCAEYLLSPNELHDQIKNAEKLDKLGFVLNSFGKSISFATPGLYIRPIIKILRRIGKLLFLLIK